MPMYVYPHVECIDRNEFPSQLPCSLGYRWVTDPTSTWSSPRLCLPHAEVIQPLIWRLWSQWTDHGPMLSKNEKSKSQEKAVFIAYIQDSFFFHSLGDEYVCFFKKWEWIFKFDTMSEFSWSFHVIIIFFFVLCSWTVAYTAYHKAGLALLSPVSTTTEWNSFISVHSILLSMKPEMQHKAARHPLGLNAACNQRLQSIMLQWKERMATKEQSW